MNKSYANQDVLEFYKELPFNYGSDIKKAAEEIISRKQDILKYYVPIPEELLLESDLRVLEMGCGTGWLSMLLAYYYGCSVTAIDFNPVAIERAIKVNAEVNQFDSGNPKFEVADLFTYEAPQFDIVISQGVLHHTDNCIEGIRKACSLVKPGGKIVLGLYNLVGRKPFLDYFDSLKKQGCSDNEMFDIYREMDDRHNDDLVQARSWFNDQVLHPHETQHTIKEVNEVFEECGVKLELTSFDGYKNLHPEIESLTALENEMGNKGAEAIQQKKYFTGYFIVTGEKVK